MSLNKAFDEICEAAKERKVEIDSERNNRLAERIAELLEEEVRKFEARGNTLDNYALNNYTNALAIEAELAIMDTDGAKEYGKQAENLVALVFELAERGKIDGVVVAGTSTPYLTVANAK